MALVEESEMNKGIMGDETRKRKEGREIMHLGDPATTDALRGPPVIDLLTTN